MKLDAIGAMQWQHTYGGSEHETWVDVRCTSDGGYVLTGETHSNDGDITGNHGETDAWIAKLDASGNIQWQHALGGTSGEYWPTVRQTSDGGYVLACGTSSNDGDVSGNHGGVDFWVAKLSASGNIQWQRTLGGTGGDTPRVIEETFDGGYVIAGHTSSNDGDVSGNHGEHDYWVVKLDSIGGSQWHLCLGGSEYDRAMGIVQTSEGGYVVTGHAFSNDGDVTGNHGDVDLWAVKLDALGNMEWQNCIGGSLLSG